MNYLTLHVQVVFSQYFSVRIFIRVVWLEDTGMAVENRGRKISLTLTGKYHIRFSKIEIVIIWKIKATNILEIFPRFHFFAFRDQPQDWRSGAENVEVEKSNIIFFVFWKPLISPSKDSDTGLTVGLFKRCWTWGPTKIPSWTFTSRKKERTNLWIHQKTLSSWNCLWTNWLIT